MSGERGERRGQNVRRERREERSKMSGEGAGGEEQNVRRGRREERSKMSGEGGLRRGAICQEREARGEERGRENECVHGWT
eukprot:275593-Amorphochlora_amoeboformis.AAC.1